MSKGKQRIAYVYILSLFLLIPLYHRGSFDNISGRKVEAFYFVSAVSLVLFAAVSLYEDFISKNKGERRRWRPCDAAAGALLCTAVLSAVLSSYRDTALYGVPGFGTGLLTLAMMVLSFGCISGGRGYPEWLFHLMAASALFPTVLALLNRMGYDPLGMYPDGAYIKGHLYVSTFGNYGWFSEYLSLLCPLVLHLFLTAKTKRTRISYGLGLVPAVLTILFAGTSTLQITLAAVACLAVCWKCVPKLRDKTIRWLPFLFCAGLPFYCAGILLSMPHDAAWNGRGYIWRLSGELFRSLSLKEKLIGVGPNCYMDALNGFLGTDASYAAAFKTKFGDLALTSAHSEYFDYLINLGILGLFCYLLFLFFVLYALRKYSLSPGQEAALLGVISYLIYAAMNFSLICATPMFFVFLGIAAAPAKETDV